MFLPVSLYCLPGEKRKILFFIDDIIRLCLDEVFFMFNYDTISAHTFKIMRDALLTIDNDLSKSLIEKMEEGIQNCKHGEPVHLIYDREMPQDLLCTIAGKLKLRDKSTLNPGEGTICCGT
ncbi:MAG: hypothetical protein LUE93_14215 [Bacteroides sp.]|nr:hypothetical protein [Bacteroides sp.]